MLVTKKKSLEESEEEFKKRKNEVGDYLFVNLQSKIVNLRKTGKRFMIFAVNMENCVRGSTMTHFDEDNMSHMFQNVSILKDIFESYDYQSEILVLYINEDGNGTAFKIDK
jgi:hypothetical protein